MCLMNSRSFLAAIFAALLVLCASTAVQAADRTQNLPMLEGIVSSVDTEHRSVVFMDQITGVTNNAEIRSANGFPMTLGQIRPNSRVSVHPAGKNAQGLPMVDKIYVLNK